MSALSLGEFEFHPTSFCDGDGRLFWSAGELYRAIPEKRAAFTRRLFADGVVAELVAEGLIPRTRLTDAAMAGYEVVLHHERIPFVSYAYEWSPVMLRDAALFAVRLLRALARRNLSLSDVASWNILFRGTRPLFVDFSAIIEAPENQVALWQSLASCFRTYFLRPLALYARGQENLARLLLSDYEHGPLQAEFDAASASHHPAARMARRIWGRGAHALRRRARTFDPALRHPLGDDKSYFMRQLERTERCLHAFNFSTKQRASARLAADHYDVLRAKIHASAPASLLLIGADDETIALAKTSGVPVLAVDRAAPRVDQIYHAAESAGSDILPLVVDLRYPAPGYGVQNAVLAPALTRLRCDLVVALGLLESFVFEQRLRFEQIAGSLAQLSLQTLVTDFPSSASARVASHLRDPYFAWFGLDQFCAALREHFARVECLAPGSDGAVLIFCEKNAS